MPALRSMWAQVQPTQGISPVACPVTITALRRERMASLRHTVGRSEILAPAHS